MERLGDLRTDFYLFEKDLTVSIFVKDHPTQIKVQENLLDLQELLNPFFNQILMRVIVSQKKVMEFDYEDDQAANERRVDLRI